MVWIDVGVFILGAVVGSFLNVCIHRMTEGCSIVFPPPYARNAAIPSPGTTTSPCWVSPAEGRCRHCGEGISPRYPLVEGLTACLACSSIGNSGSAFRGLSLSPFVCALIVVTFIDLNHQIIPHAITLPGIPSVSWRLFSSWTSGPSMPSWGS
jgi:leader peptidase (prepilin peptidase)/N-methyltransferase